jgi:hypothetical protein
MAISIVPMVPVNDRSTSGSKLENYGFIVLFFIISYALLNSFRIDKHLSADGINYFRMVLDTADFTAIAWSREFANYLTQSGLVLAAKSGLNDIPTLISIFAAGIYLPYVLSFGFCLWALRGDNKTLLIFPLSSMVAVNLSSDYILAGEHHVMVLLSWPILFFLLRRQPFTWADGFWASVLLILFCRTYETATIPALIYAVGFSFRYRLSDGKQEKFINGFCLALSIAVLMIGLENAINARDPANRSSFVDGVGAALENREAIVAATFILLFTSGLLWRSSWLAWLATIPVLIYTYVVFSADHGVSAYVSFSSRTLSLTLLPLLLTITIASWYYGIDVNNRYNLGIFAAFILIMVIGNVRFSSDWSTFRQDAIDLLKDKQGFIPIEHTHLRDNPYRWSWNNSQLSLVWSRECARAILLNPQGISWEPFNPRQTLVLKKYVEYHQLFQSIDNDARICGARG